MLIDCPHCAAGYDLDVSELTDGGVIRCAHCETMWNPDPFVAKPTAAAAKPAGRRPAIVLEAEPRGRDDGRDLIDCDVFYEEITRPMAEQGDVLKVTPAVFRYDPAAPEPMPEGAAEPPPGASMPFAAETAFAAETLRDRLLEDAAARSTPPIAENVTAARLDHAEAEIVAVVPAPPASPEPGGGETFEELEAFARAKTDALGKETVAQKPLRLVKDGPVAAPKRKMRLRWPYAAAGLAAAIAGLIVWRVEIVQAAPQTASIYAALRMPVNVRGLTFADVRTSQEKQDGVDVLVVTGQIVNPTKKPVDVPRLRLALLDAGASEVFTWATAAGKASLAPGEKLAFRSRLASPPASAEDIQVRFVSRRDTATP